MTAETAPTIKHCPYCGSDEIKFVSNVPRCLTCRAVFAAAFSRYAKKSSANFDKAIEEFKATLAKGRGEWKMVPVMPTDAMLAAAVYRTEEAGYDGPQPCKNLVYPDVQKDSLIDALLERSGHGTEREDIVRAFEAGVKFASPDVTFFGPETDFED